MRTFAILALLGLASAVVMRPSEDKGEPNHTQAFWDSRNFFLRHNTPLNLKDK